MKILKILGIVFGVLVLGLFIAFKVVMRHPPIEEVCGHIAGLMVKEGMPAAMTKPWESECPEKLKIGMLESELKYARRLRCANDSESLSAIDQCK